MSAKPLFNVKMGLKGRFVFDVIHHADGTVDHYEMDNLVTNSGLDLVGTGSAGNVNAAVIGGIAVGTGNAAPTAGDTTLQAGIAVTHTLTSQSITIVSTVAPYIIQNNYVFTFPVGAVVGNITEMAAVPASSGATDPVLSRALTEVAGTPAAITLVASDQLIVTYQFQSIMTADLTGTLNVETDGVASTMGYTIRAIGFNTDPSSSPYATQKNAAVHNNFANGLSTQAALSDVTGSLAGTGTTKRWSNGTTTDSPYVAGSYAKTITYTLGSGNAINFQWASFQLAQWFSFQMLLDSPVTLTADQTLSWPVTVSWADASGA